MFYLKINVGQIYEDQNKNKIKLRLHNIEILFLESLSQKDQLKC